MKNLIIGGIEIPFDASHTINQSYDPLFSSTILRMADGTGIKQTVWKGKTKITTSCSGKIPHALNALNYDNSIVIECVSPIVIDSATNSIAVPATRRTDIDAVGYAIVDGKSQKTGVSIIANVATLTAVSGATAYQIAYFPKFTVFANPPTESNVARSYGQHSWTLTAEEV